MNTKAVFNISLFLAAGIVLSACGRDEEVVEQDLPRPVKAYVIGGDEAAATRRLPARVFASQRAEVSFRIPGLIVDLPVKEGDFVEQGQVLAQLDKKDYQTIVNDRQAKFDEARANYERGKDLVKDGFISKMDFDRLEANYRSTKADLEQAMLDLSYTSLKASFKGQVAKRYVQNNEEVRRKQAIFALQNTGQLDIKFDLPERLVLNLRRRGVDEDAARTREPLAYVRFSSDGERFPLKLKEVATRADPQTRTFEATFSLDTPDEITVLPGMTAEVDLDMVAIYGPRDFEILVPNTTVFADPAGAKRKLVWVVNLDTMTVQSREVETGELIDDRIRIVSGLQAGESVVSAGVHHLQEGQKVRLFTGNFGE
ncbi:MAG: efflux RND transporter periplasmic adaptor subunit [Gammaproteobacteria bacterium]|nr:efflux RND transporter periplasmic adaptor subunit [Gammaproteobacteria bacterium]